MDTGKKKAGIAIICAALVITMGTGFAFAANAAQSAPVAQASNGDQQSGPVKWEPSPEYEQFGITYSEAGKMLFDGKMVRYFWDGFHVDANSYATRYDYLNEDGVVDIHTVRGIIDNGDGSYDPFGELLDIVAYSQREFDARNIEFLKNPSIQATASNDPSTNTLVSQGKTIALIFSEYSSYGITHVENSTNKAKGNVYYNGQLVKTFVNEKPDGGVFSFSSSDGGSITVYTVYDASGKLTGVKITEE